MDNQVIKFEAKPLPKLNELHHDVATAFKNDELQRLLNQPVNHAWIKKHPMVKVKTPDGKSVPLEYIATNKVKFLLTRIFQFWKCEVVSYTALFQSVAVQVRLHYQNPVTGEWLYMDGVGAVGVQTDQGASAADLGAIKFDAVMKALPAAESYALKNAASKLGSIFGGNLNNFEPTAFKGSYTPATDAPPARKLTPAEEAMLDPTTERDVYEFDAKGDSINPAPARTSAAEKEYLNDTNPTMLDNDFEL